MPRVEDIVCRARVSGQCFHGQPMYVQLGGEEDDDVDVLMLEDGTYDGESIVCDPCYVMLMPFTRSQQGLNEELSEAIDSVCGQLKVIREAKAMEDLRDLIVDTEKAMALAAPGSPYFNSAFASQVLVQAEIKRRQED